MQSTTVNISSIETTLTVATEPFPLLGGAAAGINGASVCNGEERGCQPGM